MLDIGDTLPARTLLDENGSPVALSDLGATVLFVYPAAMTPGCTAEACDFRDRYERLQGAGYDVVGVSRDAPEKNLEFKETYELPYPLLSDPDHELLDELGAWGMKKNYGREYEGVIRSTIVTDADGSITHAFRNVRAKGHAARIARELGLDDA
ncbi:MAG: peroxiredoxin [Acidimicrobiia bacterium]|nr:peroxiredoxin [Acidimicrobiia bacterium]